MAKATSNAPVIRRGGVSSERNKPALHGGETVGALPAAGPVGAAGAHPNFIYHGGPVVNCAQVYSSFWGASWQTDPTHQALAGRLNQFLTDLVASKFMNVLHQYGVNGGTFVRDTFVTNVAASLTDDDIHTVIQGLIDSGGIPEPTNATNTITLMIYLDDSTNVNNPGGIVMCAAAGDDAFGYHNFFTTKAGNPFYYAVMPGLSDACLRASCPSDAGCSLHLSETREQRLTQVTSHEFAEMVTDPQLNAWFDGNAGGENGDLCNGESATLTVGNNTWTVQRTYSKTDDVNSNGTSFCLSEAPNPIPPLSPGPGGAALLGPRAAAHPLLPLPTVVYDAKTKQSSMPDESVWAFADRAFLPLRARHLTNDLPGLLNQVAAALGRRK
jgi:hypothetical protein